MLIIVDQGFCGEARRLSGRWRHLLGSTFLLRFFLSTLAFCAAPSDKKLRRLDAYLFCRERKGLRS